MTRTRSVLIVINSMELGGAQTSLVSFLRSLELQGYAEDYDIDLLVAKPEGIFMDRIPAFVHQLSPIPELLWLGTPRGNALLTQYPSVKGRLGKLLWMGTNKQRITSKQLNEEQRIWKNWKPLIPRMQKWYDVAISYMNGFPGYYVIDKVDAGKKVLWIHNEYQKLAYDPDFDRPYYAAADQIVTISDVCVDSFAAVYPELREKICVLRNITIASDVREKGAEKQAPEFETETRLKLLSVGRLAEQKQFDLAVRTAEVLAKRGTSFLWLIIGDGPDRDMLQHMIDEKKLQGCMCLIGAKKNPYAYMARCDIFLQTSRFEGKSIVLDEAKLFQKPLIVTDYPTAKDTITDGENGLICPMDAETMADAIERVAGDSVLQNRFAASLSSEEEYDGELAGYIEKMLKG